MKIIEENIKSELFKKIPELHKYKTVRIKVENKEIKLRISSFYRTFTEEVDIDNKSQKQLLDELIVKVQKLIPEVDKAIRAGR